MRSWEAQASAQLRYYGEVMRRHREEAAHAWVRAASTRAARSASVAMVVNQFPWPTG